MMVIGLILLFCVFKGSSEPPNHDLTTTSRPAASKTQFLILEKITSSSAGTTSTITYSSLSSKLTTVWKFQDFSITQILREINFGEFRSAKIAVFANFGALKKCKNACKSQFRASKCIKMADFESHESPILISRIV